jgi:pimeloyl-ACP methyl ester carboxylesterase
MRAPNMSALRRVAGWSVSKLGLTAITCAAFAAEPAPSPTLILAPCHVDGVQEELRCGIYPVFENRQTRRGRKLPLKIAFIPARQPHAELRPVFYLTGGPGEAATEMAPNMINSIDRDEHDIVLVDERGSGDGHRLDCPSLGSDANPETYLKSPFNAAAARSCSLELARHFDLSQYTTEAFVEDLDEVRQALGYDKINLDGGSFGTYAALMYIRRHGDHVRSAYLASLDTLSNRVPLYLAQSAQLALDQLFNQCDRDAACHATYPLLRQDFATILAKLHKAPALTWVRNPVTGARTDIHLSEQAFTDAVRVMMYHEEARALPFLIEQTSSGDLGTFANAAMGSIRGFYADIRMGLFYAISCNEFVNRIHGEEVEPATRGTYLGSWRVNDEMSACKEWPKTELPADYFEPFRSNVPTVLVSGDTDPAIGPRWGEEVKSFMPGAIHLIVPGGGHTPDNACTRSVRRQLFGSGSTKGLDVSCMASLRPAPFELPSMSPAASISSRGRQ